MLLQTRTLPPSLSLDLPLTLSRSLSFFLFLSRSLFSHVNRHASDMYTILLLICRSLSRSFSSATLTHSTLFCCGRRLCLTLSLSLSSATITVTFQTCTLSHSLFLDISLTFSLCPPFSLFSHAYPLYFLFFWTTLFSLSLSLSLSPPLSLSLSLSLSLCLSMFYAHPTTLGMSD